MIDTDQNLGTLFGLKNKLILQEAQGQKCRVLIPYEEVKTFMLVHHVNVEVDTQAQKLPFWYFLLRGHLRQLRGAGDLLSELYIQALPSFFDIICPPGFFHWVNWNRRMQCLTVSTQTGSMNCEVIEPEVDSLLNLISRLTPWRKYYPVLRTSHVYGAFIALEEATCPFVSGKVVCIVLQKEVKGVTPASYIQENRPGPSR